MITKIQREAIIVKTIKKLMREKIKPAIIAHGGDIEFVSYKKGEVQVKLTGACHSCPKASLTLKKGVEEVLKYYIPEVKVVKAATKTDNK
jgi:NFU1 iron-sulfur cluster scaffold homolog, mitochondrial